MKGSGKASGLIFETRGQKYFEIISDRKEMIWSLCKGLVERFRGNELGYSEIDLEWTVMARDSQELSSGQDVTVPRLIGLDSDDFEAIAVT